MNAVETRKMSDFHSSTVTIATELSRFPSGWTFYLLAFVGKLQWSFHWVTRRWFAFKWGECARDQWVSDDPDWALQSFVWGFEEEILLLTQWVGVYPLQMSLSSVVDFVVVCVSWVRQMNLKGNGSGLIEVLSRYLPAGTADVTKNLRRTWHFSNTKDRYCYCSNQFKQLVSRSPKITYW
jgi:hypothetical protein